MKGYVFGFVSVNPIWSLIVFIVGCWLLCNIVILLDMLVSLFRNCDGIYERVLKANSSYIGDVLLQFGFVVAMIPGYMLYVLLTMKVRRLSELYTNKSPCNK